MVTEAEAGQRADVVVVSALEAKGHATTRAEVQRWIAADRVTVDGDAVRKRRSLRRGSKVEVRPLPPPLSRAEPDPSVTVDVVFEDDHLLVVEKQAGLVVHPARGHPTGTLVNGLLARGGFDASNRDPRDAVGHLRPGIVHRLDKDTSGLLVVAKHARCREGLKALFKAHDIEREYIALVVGAPRSTTYDTPHGRHPRQRLRFTTQLPGDHPKVRRAVTHVEVRERFGEAGLVRCRLETGRTHQIRVHLSECGRTPILGDALYGGRQGPEGLRSIADDLGRQALHAAVLGFVHPVTGQRLHWESELPTDIAHALDALRATRPST